jgi:hypothetical protein
MFSFTFVFHFSHFFINSKVDMASFVDPLKVVARKNAFKALQSA